MAIKLRLLDVEVIEGEDSETFQENLNTFLEDAGEKEMAEMFYRVDGGTHYALIVYVE